MFDHFLAAQEPVYEQVLGELRAGQKQTHWMWFIFPQLKDLGRSDMAKRFGLNDLAEARDYLAHPVLGERLRECTRLVDSIGARRPVVERGAAESADERRTPARTAHEIFGTPDDLKFRSSMTLFAHAAPAEAIFETALMRYFGGRGDPLTERLLRERTAEGRVVPLSAEERRGP